MVQTIRKRQCGVLIMAMWTMLHQTRITRLLSVFINHRSALNHTGLVQGLTTLGGRTPCFCSVSPVLHMILDSYYFIILEKFALAGK